MNAMKPLLALVALIAIGTAAYLFTTASDANRSDSLSDEQTELAPETEADPANLEALSELASETELTSNSNSASTRDVIRGAGRVVLATVEVPEEGSLEPGLKVFVLPKAQVRRGNGRTELDLIRREQPVDFEWSSAPVNARGVAEVPIPKTIEEPVAVIDGRFLYMERGIPIEEGMTEVALPTRFGACLVVEVLNRPEDLTEGTLRLMGMRSTGGQGFSSRSGPLLQREFRGLNDDLTWMVQVEMPENYSPGKMGIELKNGEVREVQVEVQAACWIEGTITDDLGQPMADIDVSITNLMPWMNMMGPGAKTTTDEEGRYTLGPIGPGKKTVESSEKGYVDAKSQPMELALGDRRSGVHLTLSQGLSLSGQVTWPDGKPANKTVVVAETRNTSRRMGPWGGNARTEAGRATTDKEGRFTIFGLSAGAHSLQATKRSKGKADSKATFRGELSAIEAGTQNLVLRLEAPLLLTGQVTDDLGAPIPEFSIIGRSTKDGGPTERQKFTDAEGKFTFERLVPGTWSIEAVADGFQQVKPIEMELFNSKKAIKLVLERRASLAGRVLDTAGNPVANAKVSGSDGNESRFGWGGRGGPSADTNAEGEFKLEDLKPGVWKVTASLEGWADSEGLPVELLSGTPAEDLVLTLRRGGTIVGTVIGTDGRPVSGQRVMWGSNSWGWGANGETLTDSSGRFRFETITPGEWMVTATASKEELGERMRDVDESSDFSSMMSDMLTEQVIVTEGEVAEVQLGGDPVLPVRIEGRVLTGTDPVAGAQVYAVAEGQAIMQGMKTVITDKEGRYTLTVDRPGAYIVSTTKDRTGVETFLDVPAEEVIAHDLKIPSGGIAGLVKLPDGEPGAGIRMGLERSDGLGSVRWSGNSARTSVDGTYSFESLEPGVYAVRVNTGSWGGGPNEAYASEVIGSIRVGKEGITAVDFQLKKPGSIRGVVYDEDGKPSEGTTIFFRDSQGLQISTVSSTITNAAGEYERKGLAAGTYTITAKSEDSAAVESEAVPVRTGAESRADLRVVPGTTLRVSLKDLEGDQARLRVEVFDENGHEVGRMWTLKALGDIFREGAQTNEQRLGPFAPGKYRVRASTADGRSEEITVRVSGGSGEKRLELKLRS